MIVQCVDRHVHVAHLRLRVRFALRVAPGGMAGNPYGIEMQGVVLVGRLTMYV